MAFRSSIGVPIVFLSAVFALAAPPAHADQAFLCGPDTVVYVKTEELELRKRTDPCVASHYGLKVEAGSGTSVKAEPERSPEGPAPFVKKPTNKPARPPVELKTSPDKDDGERRIEPFEERSAALLPSVAAPGTDYRNVRIINAVSGDQWFKHNR